MDENKQEGCLKFILAIIVCGALFAGYVALCVALNWRHAGGTFVFISFLIHNGYTLVVAAKVNKEVYDQVDCTGLFKQIFQGFSINSGR